MDMTIVDGVAMFDDGDLADMSGLKMGDDYVEVICGCTSQRFGDAAGRLKVFASGDLQISCECTPACSEVKLSPAAFEKHSGREGARKWKNNVWIIHKGEKTPLYKTVLLKYYNKSLSRINGSQKSCGGRFHHRDEFIMCIVCNKERRFRLKSREDCRVYHNALVNVNWKCSDFPYDRITCSVEEERASRKVYRGCSKSSSCKGCISCVCFGCDVCRFSDCSCQTCIDYTSNSRP